MRHLPNIERSAFNANTYVGYALGRVYRIARNNSPKISNTWRAQWHAGADGPFVLFAATLESMSAKLALLPNPYATTEN